MEAWAEVECQAAWHKAERDHAGSRAMLRLPRFSLYSTTKVQRLDQDHPIYVYLALGLQRTATTHKRNDPLRQQVGLGGVQGDARK